MPPASVPIASSFCACRSCAFEPIALDLGVLAIGDVFHRAGHAIRLAFFVTQRDTALAIPVPLAVTLMTQPVFDLP